MSGNLRVLVLADAATFHTARFVDALSKQGCDIALASLESSPIDHIPLKRVGPIRSLHYRLAVPQVEKLIEQFSPDIINPHFASGYGAIAAIANQRHKRPCALNLWGSDILVVPQKSPLHKSKTAAALAAADCVFGDSKYILSQAAKLATLKRTVVLPWGIERGFIQLHKKSYTLNRPLRVVVPRAHEPLYRNQFIVEALQELLHDHRIGLTFSSSGSRATEFEHNLPDNLKQNITLYPSLPRGEFLKLMATHDIYLSAARTDSSPVSMIEAMALGLIPVAADIEGVREWLTDQSGFRFPPDSHTELKIIFSHLADSDNTYENMRIGNFERVKREAVFEDNIAAQISVMRELVR